MWAIVLSGFFLIAEFVPARFVWGKSPLSWIFVAIAFAYWAYFFFGAIWVNRSAALSADKTKRIIKEGVYAKVRHPIYSADIVLGWGVFFFFPDVRFLVAAHWMMFVMLFWMRREEKALSEKFGSEYLEYMKNVPKLFPKIF